MNPKREKYLPICYDSLLEFFFVYSGFVVQVTFFGLQLFFKAMLISNGELSP